MPYGVKRKILVVYNNINFGKEATGNIVNSIFNSSNFNNDEVFFLGFGDPSSKNNNYIGINDLYLRNWNIIKKENICFLKKIICVASKIIYKISNYIKGYDSIAVCLFKKKIKQMMIKQNITHICFVSGKFDSIALLYKTRKYVYRDVKKIIYSTDVFSLKEKNKSYSWRKFYKLEKKSYKCADKIIVPFNYLSDYLNGFDLYRDKFYGIKFPSLIPIEIVKNGFDNVDLSIKNKKFTCLGTLTGAGRDPNDIIFLANELKKINEVYEINIFSYENNIFNLFRSARNIFCFDPKNIYELNTILASSIGFIILDNGEKFYNMLPSKVLTYVSYCKPIIIVGKNPNYSSSYCFLKKYPYVYYLNVDNFNENSFKNFIGKINKKNFIFNEKIYNRYKDFSVESVAEQINNLFN